VLLILCVVVALILPGVTLRAACTDSDGDGYGNPASSDCTHNSLDCNDSNAAIHPGATEVCGNGVDDNCDGIKLDPGAQCLASPPEGACATASTYMGACEDEGGLVCPAPSSGFNMPEPESWATPASCTDGRDNDCDGLADRFDSGCVSAEVCDGYDNDYNGAVDDGFNVGADCTVGQGGCQRSGKIICSGGAAICSANPGPAKEESLAANTCADNKDNDCDGSIDLADSGCVAAPTAEVCDGIDNDQDGTIDEGFDLGTSCSVGLGVCSSSGVKVCTPDGLGTECNAFPLSAAVEGPSGPTCSDGLDNDCDGTMDTEDSSCDAAATGLAVTCALPYTVGKPGSDCTGKHTVQYAVTGGSAQRVVQAEFLALSPEGDILQALPNIKVGETAHLASRLSPRDFKMITRTNKKERWHEVFAPVPLLHVTARDGDAVAEAYCSNIPYLDVIKPDGTVVSASSGDVTEVTTAIPLVDPKTLSVKIDCVNVLAALGLNPATAFPGGPYSGTVDVNGQMVEVIDLKVAAANNIFQSSSNTLTMTLKNLGGGGHVVYVNGKPVSGMRTPVTAACLTDDIADGGSVSTLAVAIDSPGDQEVVDPVPAGGVPVEGTVQHGREIAGLKLSGKEVDVSGQTFTPGNGICSADQYTLDFSEPLPMVELSKAMTGQAALGTLQRGANRVIADASDDQGNRAFATRMFAAGNVLSPAQQAMIAAKLEKQISSDLAVIRKDIMNATETKIDNAFVAGLEPEAVSNVFDKLLQDAVAEFKARAIATWQGRALGDITVEPDCSCNVTATVRVTELTFGSESDSKVTFSDGKMDVKFELPDVTIVMKAANSCETTFLGACVAETVIDVTAKTILTNPDFTFTITEEGIETNTPPGDDMKSFIIGSMRYPGSNGESLENNSDVWAANNEINCIGASICSFFEGLTGILIEVVTFGLVDSTDVFDFITIDWQLANFEDLARSTDPEPVGLGKMAINEQVVESFGQAAFAPALSKVEITSQGITAAFSATFSTQVTDPNIEETPGAALTPAPAPGPAQGTADQNGYIVLADDTINQLFASMAQSGGLQTTCQATGKTVGNLLPTDCDTLTGKTDLATASLQGMCHGVRQNDCESLTASTTLLTSTKQGACHGARGDDCSAITGLVERSACNLVPDINLTASDPLLFCAKQSIPPQFLINNGTNSGDTLASTLLLNDMTVSMVVDRPSSTNEMGKLEGELGGIPNCFAADASALADCNLFTACIDITLATQMSLDQNNQQCSADETGFVFSVNNITTSGIQAGVVCGAATQTDDTQVTGQAAQDNTVDEISNNVSLYTPPLCAKGLTLGNLLNFKNPKLISIETGGPDPYADYFGIIGEIKP
jgi:hypothetical protein